MTPKHFKLTLVIGGLAVIGLYVLTQYVGDSSGNNPPQLFGEANPDIAAIDASDYSNPRILVGFSHDIFVAKVLREVGHASSDPSGRPHIQYEVEVMYNIKGNVRGLLTVDILSPSRRGLILGGTYIFPSRRPDLNDPLYYVNEFASAVTTKSDLTRGELINTALRSERTYQLLSAYPNEILEQGDVQRGYARNSFQSLSVADKQAVYDKFAELIPPRPVPETLPLPPAPQETTETSGGSCRDGRDNDNDGLVDQSDSNCRPYYREDHQVNCSDNTDNDLDNLTDSADPDCAQFYPPPPAPLPTPPIAPPPPAPTSTPPAPVPAPLAPTSTATSTQ